METAQEIANWGWGDDQVLKDLEGAEILFAEYTYEYYSGNAIVIWRKNGQLYEAHGGHCSCYGLEGQWSPEETFAEALSVRKYLKDKDFS